MQKFTYSDIAKLSSADARREIRELQKEMTTCRTSDERDSIKRRIDILAQHESFAHAREQSALGELNGN